MKIQALGNGKVRITPDEGKILYCELDRQEHSEAIVEQDKTKFFKNSK